MKQKMNNWINIYRIDDSSVVCVNVWLRKQTVPLSFKKGKEARFKELRTPWNSVGNWKNTNTLKIDNVHVSSGVLALRIKESCPIRCQDLKSATIISIYLSVIPIHYLYESGSFRNFKYMTYFILKSRI